ncbi:MAG: thioredoxin family protein [Thermoplasmata archaeon]
MEDIGLKIGDPAPSFELPGVDGKTYKLEDFADRDVLGVIFMCVHCPYVQAYEDRIMAAQADYSGKGVQFVGINPNDSTKYPEDSFDGMVKRAGMKGYNFPYLRDKGQDVADAYGAQATPEFFIFDKERKLAYRGRLDDNYQDPSAVREQYLRAALDAILAGREPDKAFVPAIGCSIKWVD